MREPGPRLRQRPAHVGQQVAPEDHERKQRANASGRAAGQVSGAAETNQIIIIAGGRLPRQWLANKSDENDPNWTRRLANTFRAYSLGRGRAGQPEARISNFAALIRARWPAQLAPPAPHRRRPARVTPNSGASQPPG